MDRIAFFQNAAKAEKTAFSISQAQALIERYLQRDQERLSALKSERRQGRPPNPREQLLMHKIANDEREYVAGFWIPDMEDQKNVELLAVWSGEWVGLNVIKFVRLSRSGNKINASFPPQRGN